MSQGKEPMENVETEGAMGAKADFDDPEFFKRFKKAAEDQRKRSTASPAAARRSLVKLGILTKNGKVSAKYRTG